MNMKKKTLSSLNRNNIMPRYIFLDIDGVLNNRRTHTISPYGCKGVSKKNIDVLKEIINKTKGQIVLISDWRLSFLPNDHMPQMAVYITKKMHEAGLEFMLVSENRQYENRAKEIIRWLNEHPAEGYIIIDDEEYHYREEPLRLHLVHIKENKGLTSRNVPEAIEKMSLPITLI